MSEEKAVDKRINRSKTALKDAFVQLLREASPENITVTDIVGQAGYSRATFYAHYKDIDDFIMSIIDDEIDKYVEVISGTIKKNKGIIYDDESTYQPALDFFQYVFNNRDIYKLILCSNVREQTLDYFCDMAYGKFINLIRVRLRGGHKRGIWQVYCDGWHGFHSSIPIIYRRVRVASTVKIP